MTSFRAAHRHATRRARGGVLAAKITFAALLILLAAAAWVGTRALLAKGELESAIPLASRIERQIVAGDGEAAARTFDQLSARAANAASLTSDPVWRAFETVPLIGPNLSAVREIGAAVDLVSRNAVGPLTEVAGSIQLSDFKPVGGAINVDPLLAAQPRVAEAHKAMTSAEQQILSIDTSQTLAAVRQAVGDLESAVVMAAGAVGSLDRAVRLVPKILGAEGPRNYLLLFQNPAEARATGGISGAVALIHTENGRIEMSQQASSSDFPHFTSPVLELPAETRGLYGDITGQYIQDVNLTPNFPLSAQLAREMWRRQFGVEADGVFSIDPVALSYLLKATGPISLPTGDVMSTDNAVMLLLSDAYVRYEPSKQDAFFAGAAAAVFSTVASGNVDPMALLEALAKAGDERRVLVWSSDVREQAVLAGTTLAGGLPKSDKHTTRFGIYLNDATGAKMDTYLDVEIGVGRASCRADGRPNYGVKVELTNTAPANAGSTLPEYVTGGGNFGVKPGNVKTVVAAYGAPGMQNLGMTRDGKAIPYHPATDSAHPVSSVSVELAPGETTVLDFGWLGAEAFFGELAVQRTPGINTSETRKMDISCESPIE